MVGEPINLMFQYPSRTVCCFRGRWLHITEAGGLFNRRISPLCLCLGEVWYDIQALYWAIYPKPETLNPQNRQKGQQPVLSLQRLPLAWSSAHIKFCQTRVPGDSRTCYADFTEIAGPHPRFRVSHTMMAVIG